MNEPTAQANSFEITLREMRGGRSLAELSESLAKLVEGVRRTGSAGALTYRLKVKPASAGDNVILSLEDDIECKAPREKRGGSIFYADDGNLLQRRDPRQQEFQLKSVPVSHAEEAKIVLSDDELKSHC